MLCYVAYAVRFDYELFFVVRGRLNNMTTARFYVVKVGNSVRVGTCIHKAVTARKELF